MNKNIYYLVLLLSGLANLFLFQNCSQNISLQNQTNSTSSRFLKMPTGAFCTEPDSAIGISQKIAFIIDMSSSNLGGTYRAATPSGNSYFGFNYWRSGVNSAGNPPRPWRDYATDPDGNRFQAIADIFSSPACSNLNDQNKYALIGFSTGNVFSDPSNTCESPFVSNLTFENQLTQLAGIQEADKNMGTGPEHQVFSDFFPFSLRDTSYSRGLDCFRNKIANEIFNNPNEISSYSTFFISDGAPTFNPCENSLTTQQMAACLAGFGLSNCYTNNTINYACIRQNYDYIGALSDQLQEINFENSTFVTSLKTYTILYTNNALLGTPDYNDAVNVLDQLSETGGTGTSTGGQGVIELTANGGSFDQLTNAICSQLDQVITNSFKIDSFLAVNLTAINKKGILYADSDMDGLTDEEELASNIYSPINPRTLNNVNDKLCKMNAGNCNVSSCNATLPYSLGLNDCDKKFLQQRYSLSGDFLDTDNDKIIDYIEILRGLNFNLSDATSDRDNDGSSNLKEIIAGTDLHNSDSLFPTNSLDKTNVVFSSAPTLNCGNSLRGFRFQFNSLGLVKTKEYIPNSSENASLNLGHEENENVILVLYFSGDSRGSSNLKVYGSIIKMHAETGALTPSALNSANFVVLGEITR